MSKEEKDLKHYGMPRRSGRYPWGSGEDPYQRNGDFLARVEELKSYGDSEAKIAKSLGMSTTKLRARKALAKSERRAEKVARAKSLAEDGLNRVEIASIMGLKGESTVRSLLNSDAEARMNIAEKTANSVKDIVDQKGMVDVGTGVDRQLGISQEKMNQALEILKMEGYEVYSGGVPQATNKGKQTILKVLAKPGTPHSEIYNYEKIGTLDEYKADENDILKKRVFHYPSSMDSSRIMVRHGEEGGAEKDGVIELRRGANDLSLGEANYAQVRMLVDNEKYLKGMAVYSDDMPEGVDVIFNTNKPNTGNKMDALKKIKKDDPDNPFGSAIKENGGQSYYIDENGEKKLSVINKRADEGDWGQWSNKISSQFLAKQPLKMIKQQLKISEADKEDELNSINELTNPTVKKALLLSFGDDADAAAVDLKAASLPGQKYKVILPITSLKSNETYAPHLEDGSRVALVRYPHGGTFEIPIVTVNNRNKDAIDIMSTNPSDAMGINAEVAARLSGADFDGDTVMAIPLSDKVKVKSTNPENFPALKALEGFDPTMSYGPDEIKIINGTERYFRGGKQFSPMKETAIQPEMGKISNLITDMTLRGASHSEIARAVKHSMVVIDANKHGLDYKQSAKDNGIASLHDKYQPKDDPNKKGGGASTLISKASSEKRVPERKEGAFVAKDTGNELTLIDPDKQLYFDKKTNRVYTQREKETRYIDPDTGEKLYRETGRTYNTVEYKSSTGKTKKSSVYVMSDGKYKIPKEDITLIKDNKLYFKDEDGNFSQVTRDNIKTKAAENKTTKMADAKDARELSSGTPQEEAYADYANKMKSLANEARKEFKIIKDIPYSKSARKAYMTEVENLNHKLNQALLNAPKERRAQTLAASAIKSKTQENPSMTDEQKKKISQQELARARFAVGAQRQEVQISEKEWEAIQSGAISATKLKSIIANADLDILRKLAMPRSTVALSANKVRRIGNMANAGYTTSEIASALGVSPTTVTKYLKGDAS